LKAADLIVLGRGRLGQSLARALKARLVAGREWRGGLPFKEGARIFLAVPDPAIEPLAAELAALPLPPGAAVVHLSGALGLEPLAPVAEAGAAVGSFHPLQSFPVVRDPAAFRGALVAVDASSAKLLGELTRLARTLGARPRRVPPEQRTLYHAAAVMASNYLVALGAQATEVLQRAGWSRAEALEALLPLMRGVLLNLESAGLPDALIGPIRRGDPDTVSRQLGELTTTGGGIPLEVYRILGRAALELAREAGLDAESARRIEEALTAP
jgi:predicted short-subunit dehydrogenase-like oxidoreductase (DUF2520 family)